LKELAEALKGLREKDVYQLVDEKITEGVSPVEIINECNEGMVAIGELFSSGEYFLSQLVFSGVIMKEVAGRLEPLLAKMERGESLGKVVVGTVKGDVHDIGKNIVVGLLRGAGFEVFDLGVDVPAQKFVEKLQETGARVLGLSALLSSTYPELKNVIDALAEAGLRDQVVTIIGGAPVDEQVREFAGADYYAKDAVAGVSMCKVVYASA
jgi:methylmalonyl-CoA mutase cobalamin-binding domain/chain